MLIRLLQIDAIVLDGIVSDVEMRLAWPDFLRLMRVRQQFLDSELGIMNEMSQKDILNHAVTKTC